ncbi:hypothetical protein M8J76_008488 [Diaphorina citri]|nr:hypothetical protein M8J75_015778 [Diaphorina citri]KAI5723595.1 hypothetical protein M8J76_008488 [Diaphorina citri]KAI5728962.1 hypothetical protein M8J77_023713 [Diaphorina citri]
MACAMPMYQEQNMMKVIETVRQLSGPANNFVSETLVLNALSSFNPAGLAKDGFRKILAGLVKANRMECFVPVTNLGSCGPCGPCGCGADCGGCCAGGCGGCGRYYRVKIG